MPIEEQLFGHGLQESVEGKQDRQKTSASLQLTRQPVTERNLNSTRQASKVKFETAKYQYHPSNKYLGRKQTNHSQVRSKQRKERRNLSFERKCKN